jgi:nitrogenase molybdenum-iron protein alpha/beta subunit
MGSTGVINYWWMNSTLTTVEFGTHGWRRIVVNGFNRGHNLLVEEFNTNHSRVWDPWVEEDSSKWVQQGSYLTGG